MSDEFSLPDEDEIVSYEIGHTALWASVDCGPSTPAKVAVHVRTAAPSGVVDIVVWGGDGGEPCLILEQLTAEETKTLSDLLSVAAARAEACSTDSVPPPEFFA